MPVAGCNAPPISDEFHDLKIWRDERTDLFNLKGLARHLLKLLPWEKSEIVWFNTSWIQSVLLPENLLTTSGGRDSTWYCLQLINQTQYAIKLSVTCEAIRFQNLQGLHQKLFRPGKVHRSQELSWDWRWNTRDSNHRLSPRYLGQTFSTIVTNLFAQRAPPLNWIVEKDIYLMSAFQCTIKTMYYNNRREGKEKPWEIMKGKVFAFYSINSPFSSASRKRSVGTLLSWRKTRMPCPKSSSICSRLLPRVSGRKK